MQTYYPWGSPKGAPEPKQWQHDILRKDGTPFSAAEVKLIKKLTGKGSGKSQSTLTQLTFSKNEYAGRREKLMNQIPDGIAILRGAPTSAGDNLFNQYTNMMYFTGMEIPNIILVIDGQSKTSTIFITLDEDGAKNEGIPYELVQDPGKFNGIENVLPYEQFTPWLTAKTEKCHTFYTPFKSEELPGDVSAEKTQSLKNSMTKDEWDGRLTRELQFVEQLKKKIPVIEVKDCWNMISDLRKIKSKEEIEIMREAGRIGRAAHLAFIQATGVGVKEIDLANLFENTCKTNGAMGLAYYTIIMSAENIPYGHYHGYNRTLQDGDFVVLDAGPDYKYYGVDFSTSFPANGKFTPKQKELYELANAIREVCVNSYKPGITLKMVGQNVKKYLIDNGYNPDEPRFKGLINYGGYNHSVGMAVHDGMGTFKGPDEVLREGFVFACDINMMYPDIEIGVRLEDTVVITSDGCEVLSAGLPRKASEMEKAMKKN
jgi:Xaa-Pro aminopeptidase